MAGMRDLQQRIASELGVAPQFEAAAEIARRVQFLADYARVAGAHALVLGISGGVDSAVAGRLCQLAVEQLRPAGMQLKAGGLSFNDAWQEDFVLGNVKARQRMIA